MDGAQTCSWHTERRAHSASPSNSSTSDAFEAATGAASLQEVQLRSAVVQLITGLGDPDQLREGLRDTPKRVAKAWRQVVPAPGETVDSVLGGAVFHEDIVSCGAGGLIAVEDICFSSTSEADLLPFYGRCYVGYIPTGGNVIGLSKAARLAAHFGQRVQSQQTFTQRFLDGLDEHLRPQGAAICVVAQHLGEALHTRPPRRVTLAASGSFQDSSSLHLQEFLSLVDCPEVGQGARGQSPGSQQSGVSASLIPGYNSAAVCPEPDTSYARAPERELAGSRWSVIGQAAEAMLHSLGQDTRDPTRLLQSIQSALAGYATFMRNATTGYSLLPLSLPPLSAEALSSRSSPSSSSSSSSGKLTTVVVDFMSLCEHHLLPFCGTLAVGLALAEPAGPAGSVSQEPAPEAAIAAAVRRCVAAFSRRLQIQERLSHQVADALQPLAVEGSLVVSCTAAHMCMIARGVQQHCSRTTTHAARGVFARDPAARLAALAQLRRP